MSPIQGPSPLLSHVFSGFLLRPFVWTEWPTVYREISGDWRVFRESMEDEGPGAWYSCSWREGGTEERREGGKKGVREGGRKEVREGGTRGFQVLPPTQPTPHTTLDKVTAAWVQVSLPRRKGARLWRLSPACPSPPGGQLGAPLLSPHPFWKARVDWWLGS